MWWAAAISAGLALFGAVKQRQAGRQAGRIGDMNAQAERAEGLEQFRRSRLASKQRVGYARAVAGASGFSIQPGTSQASYIDALEREDKRQRDFGYSASRSRQKILRAGGQAAASTASAGMWSSIGSAATYAGQAWSTRPGT